MMNIYITIYMVFANLLAALISVKVSCQLISYDMTSLANFAQMVNISPICKMAKSLFASLKSKHHSINIQLHSFELLFSKTKVCNSIHRIKKIKCRLKKTQHVRFQRPSSFLKSSMPISKSS